MPLLHDIVTELSSTAGGGTCRAASRDGGLATWYNVTTLSGTSSSTISVALATAATPQWNYEGGIEGDEAKRRGRRVFRTYHGFASAYRHP